MSACLRLLALFALVLTLLVGASRLAAPRLLADLGLDWQSLPDLYRIQEEERRKTAELQRVDDLLKVRLKGKEEVIRRLLDGELTLLQAAARFKRLNAEPADLPCEYRRAFPAASDGESLCRQVIVWAEAELNARGQSDDSRGRRLRADLDEIVRRDGTVELPEE